ncbi:MAG: hypothetical protein HQ521_00245, partial [Bacteroidetes bacterium]|nr:hypothetical protein [Bacteroidota bacterium]
INSTLSIVSVALVITALSILTYQRNAIWANPERLYKAELAINNNKPRIHGVLGKYYKEQKQYEEAVNSYKIAFELSGNVRDIDNQGFLKKFSYLNNYATNLVRAGKVDEAILVIKQFLPEVKNKKHLARIYSNLGIFYSLKNNYYQCIQSLSKSIELDNKMVEPILFSGKCYARLGNKEMATKMFNRALTLSPDSSRVKAIMKSVGY